MSWRAKLYLTVGSLRHLIIGFALLLTPHTFDSPAFKALFQIAPRWFWCTTLLLGGVHLGYSALRGLKGHARVALTMSAVVSLMWATAFGLVVLSGFASVMATVIFAALGFKDLIQCAQPMRLPFEDMPETLRPTPHHQA